MNDILYLWLFSVSLIPVMYLLYLLLITFTVTNADLLLLVRTRGRVTLLTYRFFLYPVWLVIVTLLAFRFFVYPSWRRIIPNSSSLHIIVTVMTVKLGILV